MSISVNSMPGGFAVYGEGTNPNPEVLQSAVLEAVQNGVLPKEALGSLPIIANMKGMTSMASTEQSGLYRVTVVTKGERVLIDNRAVVAENEMDAIYAAGVYSALHAEILRPRDVTITAIFQHPVKKNEQNKDA